MLHAADAPYRGRGTTMIPLQFLTDFIPRRLPETYEYEPSTRTLRITGAGFDGLAMPERGADPSALLDNELRAPSPYTGTRVVVIDAGRPMEQVVAGAWDALGVPG